MSTQISKIWVSRFSLQKRDGYIRTAYINEYAWEGLMKGVWNLLKDSWTFSRTRNKTLTQVNLHFKSLTTPYKKEYYLDSFLSSEIVKKILDGRGEYPSVYAKLVLVGYRRNVTYSYSANIYRMFVNHVIKSGNSGNKVDKFFFLFFNTCVVLLQNVLYHYSMFILVNELIKKRGALSISGGKIVEKAKALCNNKDNKVQWTYSDLELFGKGCNRYLCSRILECRLNSTLFNRVCYKLAKVCQNFNLKKSSVWPFRVSYNLVRSYNFSSRRYKNTISDAVSTLRWPVKWAALYFEIFQKQVKLAHLVTDQGAHSPLVHRYQNQLLASLTFRFVAVHKLSHSRESRIPGIDGFFLNGSVLDKLKLVEELRDLSDYKAEPVRRVNVSMIKDKESRLVGVPTIKDRAVQMLFRLIIEPVTEVFADCCSYGYRPNRTALQALAQVDYFFRSKNKKFVEQSSVFYADVAGCFEDSTLSSWIIENFPFPCKYLYVLKSWLYFGLVERVTYYGFVNSLVQQHRGVISVLIFNYMLDGLEKVVKGSLKVSRKSEKVSRVRGSSLYKNTEVQIVRYVNDFIILGCSKNIIFNYVRPAVKAFLKERGLRLVEKVTRVTQLNQYPLYFLGYIFVYKEKWKVKRFREGAFRSGVAMYPHKEEEVAIKKKIRNIFHYSIHRSAFFIIQKVNDLIFSWSCYFSLGQSYRSRLNLDRYIFKLCWNWARRKHPCWGSRAIVRIYFLDNNKKWVFRSGNKAVGTLNTSNCRIIYIRKASRVVKGRNRCLIPVKYRSIHGFHRDVAILLSYFNQHL